MVIAICSILYHNYKKPFLFNASKHFQDGQVSLKFAEDVTFINKASIQRTLTKVPNGSKVILDASKTVNMDHNVREIITKFIEEAEHRDITVEVVDLNFSRMKNQYKEIAKVLVKQA